jgi:hypothetical protein
MADLTHGTRIRHVKWGTTGTIRQVGGDFEIRFDGIFGDALISDDGVVYPEDVEIIRDGAR